MDQNGYGEQTTINTSRYGTATIKDKYNRPYPGYAFEFGNIDNYTGSRAPEKRAIHTQNS
jgi:hypothetical protein